MVISLVVGVAMVKSSCANTNGTDLLDRGFKCSICRPSFGNLFSTTCYITHIYFYCGLCEDSALEVQSSYLGLGDSIHSGRSVNRNFDECGFFVRPGQLLRVHRIVRQ